MAKIYGQLEVAQIHNKTSDPASPPAGLVIWRTDLGLMKVATGSGSTYVTQVDTSTAQTLTSKTLTAPTLTTPVTDIHSLTDQGSTPSTPSSGTTKFYSKTDGKLYFLTSAGVEQPVGSGASGSGSRNYVSSNPDAETVTTGWATYKDAAATTPVDGTAGSPTLTFTRTTSTPLRGSGSFLITTTAANLQGEGASYDFTLDRADQAKILAISFDYNIASGTYADGDMTLYIYDVTNSLLIQPAGYSIANLGSSSIYGRVIATFQTSASSTSYRLIFHRAVSTASAMTMKIDNLVVGPQIVQYGPPITSTNSIPWTPTSTWSSNVTHTGAWWREGDRMKGWVNIAISGAPTAATLAVNLPSGYSIDTTKMYANSNNQVIGGVSALDTSAGATFLGSVQYSSATAMRPLNWSISGARVDDAIFNATTPVTFAAGDNIYMTFDVPILGWDATVQMSSDTDTRIVSARYTNCTTSVGTTIGAMVYATKDFDTHNSYNNSTGAYTVPVPGYYRVTMGWLCGSGTGSVNNGVYSSIRVNTVVKSVVANFLLQTTSSVSPCSAGSGIVYCNAGDTIDAAIQRDAGAPAVSVQNNNFTYLNIERLSGPSAIAASESVSCKYTNTAGTTYGTGSTVQFPAATRVFDTHGAWVTDTFTAPVAGKYYIGGQVTWTSITADTGYQYMDIRKSGTVIKTIYQAIGKNAAGGNATGMTISTIIDLIAGDTLKIFAKQTSSASTTLATIADGNCVEIYRIGN